MRKHKKHFIFYSSFCIHLLFECKLMIAQETQSVGDMFRVSAVQFVNRRTDDRSNRRGQVSTGGYTWEQVGTGQNRSGQFAIGRGKLGQDVTRRERSGKMRTGGKGRDKLGMSDRSGQGRTGRHRPEQQSWNTITVTFQSQCNGESLSGITVYSILSKL